MATCSSCGRVAGILVLSDRGGDRLVCPSCEVHTFAVSSFSSTIAHSRCSTVIDSKKPLICLSRLRYHSDVYRRFAFEKTRDLPDYEVTWRPNQDGSTLMCPDCGETCPTSNTSTLLAHFEQCRGIRLKVKCACGEFIDVTMDDVSAGDSVFIALYYAAYWHDKRRHGDLYRGLTTTQ